ncbi:hypothetical protein BDW02DRAFT_44488 [Decorospora gaudefroyi]|uniref:Uncharacterized protein n=1 Tax=Decorospora gaudefroyi TaxID=184978 RepID=A0A6A5K320_9PLEO|nr:hypothetical protein BDW02DRAFT_44488 [Decorospora gaudefroyi]
MKLLQLSPFIILGAAFQTYISQLALTRKVVSRPLHKALHKWQWNGEAVVQHNHRIYWVYDLCPPMVKMRCYAENARAQKKKLNTFTISPTLNSSSPIRC